MGLELDRIQGNTLRDWLDLLIAPFLLPAVLKAVHTRASHCSPDPRIDRGTAT